MLIFLQFLFLFFSFLFFLFFSIVKKRNRIRKSERSDWWKASTLNHLPYVIAFFSSFFFLPFFLFSSFSVLPLHLSHLAVYRFSRRWITCHGDTRRRYPRRQESPADSCILIQAAFLVFFFYSFFNLYFNTLTGSAGARLWM